MQLNPNFQVKYFYLLIFGALSAWEDGEKKITKIHSMRKNIEIYEEKYPKTKWNEIFVLKTFTRLVLSQIMI